LHAEHRCTSKDAGTDLRYLSLADDALLSVKGRRNYLQIDVNNSFNFQQFPAGEQPCGAIPTLFRERGDWHSACIVDEQGIALFAMHPYT
jgi:hypothetical protein